MADRKTQDQPVFTQLDPSVLAEVLREESGRALNNAVAARVGKPGSERMYSMMHDKVFDEGWSLPEQALADGETLAERVESEAISVELALGSGVSSDRPPVDLAALAQTSPAPEL